MDKDSGHINHNEESEEHRKTPSSSSINFVRQFARIYSTTHGGEFSYLILN